MTDTVEAIARSRVTNNTLTDWRVFEKQQGSLGVT